MVRVEDVGGHHWTFSQIIADIDPATWSGTLFPQLNYKMDQELLSICGEKFYNRGETINSTAIFPTLKI